jgi:hypothetical protein
MLDSMSLPVSDDATCSGQAGHADLAAQTLLEDFVGTHGGLVFVDSLRGLYDGNPCLLQYQGTLRQLVASCSALHYVPRTSSSNAMIYCDGSLALGPSLMTSTNSIPGAAYIPNAGRFLRNAFGETCLCLPRPHQMHGPMCGAVVPIRPLQRCLPRTIPAFIASLSLARRRSLALAADSKATRALAGRTWRSSQLQAATVRLPFYRRPRRACPMQLVQE